jgi:Fe-S-cluster containining protein
MDDGFGHADCTVEDVARLSRRVRSQLVVIRGSDLGGSCEATRATPTIMTEEFGGVCRFLAGTPGRRVSCRIYGTRPTACRDYPPGSNGCMAARAELGLEARVAIKKRGAA